MGRHLGRLQKAAVLYWGGVWLTILSIILLTNGDPLSFPAVLSTMLFYTVVSGALVFGLSSLVGYIQRKLKYSLSYIVWFTAPVFFILLFMETIFGTVSGGTYGIDSIRRETLVLIMISCFWSFCSFWMIRKTNAHRS